MALGRDHGRRLVAHWEDRQLAGVILVNLGFRERFAQALKIGPGEVRVFDLRQDLEEYFGIEEQEGGDILGTHPTPLVAGIRLDPVHEGRGDLPVDVREVRQGFECGISLKAFSDFVPGDVLECYTVEKVAAS